VPSRDRGEEERAAAGGADGSDGGAAAPSAADYAAAERLRRSASAGLGEAPASDAVSDSGASGASRSSAQLWQVAVAKVGRCLGLGVARAGAQGQGPAAAGLFLWQLRSGRVIPLRRLAPA
jgi:hypothetical protein